MNRHGQGTKLLDHASHIARFGRGNDRKQRNHHNPTYQLAHINTLSLAMHRAAPGKSAQAHSGLGQPKVNHFALVVHRLSEL
jgi:hypothetical protein